MVIAALHGALLTALLAAGGALLVLLFIWILLHHTRPELKIDIGVRGWVNLTRPKDEVTAEEPAEPAE